MGQPIFFLFAIGFRTCWQRDRKTRDRMRPKVRVIVARGRWSSGGCAAAAVKSMEQPRRRRRRNASRLRAAYSRRRDVCRFRRRYRRRDAPETFGLTRSRIFVVIVFGLLQQRYYWASAAAVRLLLYRA